MHDVIDRGGAWLVATGEMSRRIRDLDWGQTTLGALESWPQSLRTAVGLMLASREPVSILWGPEHIQLYNDAYVPIAGERHPDALGRPASEVWEEAFDSFLGPTFARVLGGETVEIDEHAVQLRTRQGRFEERHFTASFMPIADESGGVGGVFHPLTEVTAEVRARAALRQREERLHRVLNGMAEGFGLLAPDFTILEQNLEALRMDGRPREEIVGRSHWEVYPESEHSELGRVLKKAMAERVPVSLEHGHAWEGGGTRWLEMRAYPTSDGALAVFWRDVTDRKQAEEALREERDRNAEILESISDAFYAVDANWRFTYVNRVAEGWWGRSREDLLGKVYWDEFPEAVGSNAYKAHLRAAEERQVVRLDTLSPILDHWVDISIYPAVEGGLAVYCRDITEKKQAETRLHESEARLRALTDNLPAGMVYQIATGADGLDRRFLYVSQSHEKLTGVPADAVLADPTIPYHLIVPEDRHRLAEAEAAAIAGKTPFDVEVRLRRTDGEVRWCRIISAPREQADGSLIWDGIQVDTTDQKLTEAALRELNDTLEQRVAERTAELEQAHEQLRQSQKLEAMGNLTGGVAHDFNNLLSPIIGSLDLLLKKGFGNERERRLMDGALQSAERARVLVQRLLSTLR